MRRNCLRSLRETRCTSSHTAARARIAIPLRNKESDDCVRSAQPPRVPAGGSADTADVDIELVVQVVHSVGSIRFGRLSLREPSTVLVCSETQWSGQFPSSVQVADIDPGGGQGERHPHALRDPRGIGDRFRP
jgi:hypothetical protein